MNAPDAPPIRRIKVEVAPTCEWGSYGLRTRVRIDVRTALQTVSVCETLDSSDFASHLRALLLRIEREVLQRESEQ